MQLSKGNRSMGFLSNLCLFIARFLCSDALCSGTGVLTSAYGTLIGQSTYTENDQCTWIVNPANADMVSVSLVDTSHLASGDTISIYSCSSSSCTSPTLMATCTASQMICDLSVTARQYNQHAIVMVRFQGGSSGVATGQLLHYGLRIRHHQLLRGDRLQIALQSAKQ